MIKFLQSPSSGLPNPKGLNAEKVNGLYPQRFARWNSNGENWTGSVQRWTVPGPRMPAFSTFVIGDVPFLRFRGHPGQVQDGEWKPLEAPFSLLFNSSPSLSPQILPLFVMSSSTTPRTHFRKQNNRCYSIFLDGFWSINPWREVYSTHILKFSIYSWIKF